MQTKLTAALALAVIIVAFIPLAGLGVLFAAETSTTNGAPVMPSLPFSVSVHDVTPDKLPEYLDPFRYSPPNGQWLDFPHAAVRIGDELWVIYKNGYDPRVIRYKGTNIEDAVRQPDGTFNATHAKYGTVTHPYILGRMWYDPETRKLYAPMHCEYPEVFRAAPGVVDRQIHLAVSADKGLTWTYEGPLLTGLPAVHPYDRSGLYWDGGNGDFYLYVDERGGYFYLFTTSYLWPKYGVSDVPFFMRHHVARCRISDKMASGKWQRYFNGQWNEPGIGGKSSYVGAFCVVFSKHLGKYISLDYGTGMSACTDLAKQDWSPCVVVPPGNCWGTVQHLAMSPMDETKTDTWAFDKTLYVYSYLSGWMSGPAAVYRLDFAAGRTEGLNLGWGAGVGFLCTPPKFFEEYWAGVQTMTAVRPYGEPSYDSPDAIESRRVRKVSCSSPEAVYSGEWSESGTVVKRRSSTKTDDSVSLIFHGTGIYWRAQQGPDCGTAEVWLDGQLAESVDCFGIAPSDYVFYFIRTGLDPAKPHTIKIVVRGKKNAKATGQAIRHIAFECAGESNQASDGFSGLAGKNDWHYLAWDGSTFAKLDFDREKNLWQKAGGPAVGHNFLASAAAGAVRQWQAPRDGAIRVEGVASVDAKAARAIEVKVMRNADAIWPVRAVEPGTSAAHDVRVEISKGDTISFIATRQVGATGEHRVAWDPVITFIVNDSGQREKHR